ncbi:site-specific integrase, partial [Acinetobacter baumannii]
MEKCNKKLFGRFMARTTTGKAP